MSDPKARMKWIPTSALPVDLLAQAVRQGSAETRTDKSVRTLRLPSWTRGLVAFAGAWAICAAAFAVEPLAFRSLTRWLPLVIGAGLVALAIARRRASGIRPERGQGLVIGPTSLVVVDAHEVAVLPAERLAVSVDQIELDGVVIDNAFHDPDWRKRLDAAVAAARSGEEARAKDRWRIAADAAGETARPSFTARNATAIAAAGAGIFFALFLEAGPLHARALATMKGERADWERVGALRDATAATLTARLDVSQAWTETMRDKIREEDRVKAEAAKKLLEQERVQAEARKGQLQRLDAMQKADPSVDDVLEFTKRLPKDDDVLQARALDLLRSRCRAQYPDNGGTQRQRVQRLFLRVLCADDTAVLTYSTSDDTAEDAKTVADALAVDLTTLSETLGRTIRVRARVVYGEAMLEIDIKLVGKPKRSDDNPKRMDQDCVVTVKLLDEALKDPLATRQYVTNGVLGVERR